MMGSLLVLYVLLCIHIFQYGVNCGVILNAPDRALNEQPFKSLCSTNCQESETDKAADENAFPLYKCSCTPSCVVYGDCCYDSKYNTSTWTKTDFICLSVVDRGRYRAVSGCPSDQVTDFCKSGIGHLPPVTSRTTGTTYANIFCASCNNDAESLVTWNVELRCSGDQEDQKSDDEPAVEISDDKGDEIKYHLDYLWNFSRNNKSKSLCMYHVHYNDFSIVDGLELRGCDNTKKISDCSASWRDSNVMKLCRSYEDPVFFDDRLYRNYHCAECNYMSLEYLQCMPFHIQIMHSMGLIDSETIKFCQQRGSQSCIQYLSDNYKGLDFSLHDMLKFTSEERCVPPECCSGYRYRRRFNECRKIHRKN